MDECEWMVSYQWDIDSLGKKYVIDNIDNKFSDFKEGILDKSGFSAETIYTLEFTIGPVSHDPSTYKATMRIRFKEE